MNHQSIDRYITNIPLVTKPKRLSKKAFDDMAEQYTILKNLRKFYEEQEREALERIKEATKEKAYAGYKFVLSNLLRKGSIEYKNIPQLKEIDLEQYRGKNVITWRVSSVEGNNG